jgi:hypothetical protein
MSHYALCQHILLTILCQHILLYIPCRHSLPGPMLTNVFLLWVHANITHRANLFCSADQYVCKYSAVHSAQTYSVIHSERAYILSLCSANIIHCAFIPFQHIPLGFLCQHIYILCCSFWSCILQYTFIVLCSDTLQYCTFPRTFIAV